MRQFGYTRVASERPRSFLFCVVANIGSGGGSRPLAVVYRQGRDTNSREGYWTREDHAVADIIAIIEILSDPANRAPLEAERALAEDWYRRSQGDNEPEVNEQPSVPDTPPPPFVMPNAYCWGRRVEQAQLLPELPWHDDRLSEFPFTTTVRPGDVQLQPLSTIFRGDCKEYGLIILDISDLDNVKHGIVAFDVHYMADVFYGGPEFYWDPNIDPPPEKKPDTVLQGLRLREPLSIAEWLREDYFARAKDPRILRLKTSPVIHRSVLNYIWPQELKNQATKSSQGVITSISDYFWPPKPTARAKYDPADLYLNQNTIGNFQKLTEFREQIRRRLEDVPDSLGPSKLSSYILRVAYAGRIHLNWVIFRNLPLSVIAAAIASDELRGASALSLCVDKFKLEGERGLSDLEAALSQSTGLKQLCLLQGPDRDSDNASAHFWTQQQQQRRSSGDLGWLRDKTIYLTCAFSSSLCNSKLSSPLTTTPVVQAFPVMHIFTFVDNADPRFQKHQNRSSSSYYDDMSNTLLTAERFAVRFLSYLRSVGLGSDKAVLRFAYEEPHSSSSGRFAVSPIPAGHFAPPPEINDQSRVRVGDIDPGSWVVLVDQRSRNSSDGDTSLLRYAFVRIGRPSSETASEKQPHRPSPVLLEVVGGLMEFLCRTVRGIDLFLWEKRVEEVEKDLRARASTETGKRCMGIGVMDESSALALLDQIL